MCCQIFHNFSFKYEHDFSSITFMFVSGEPQLFVPSGPQFRGSCFQGSEKKPVAWGARAHVGRRGGQWVWMHLRLPHPWISLHPQTRWPWLLTPGDVLLISLRGLLCHKDHTVGGLNHRHLSHSPGDWPGDWKSRIEVWAGLGPWGLFLACGRPSPPCVLVGSSVCLSLCPDLLFLQGPLLWGVRARLSAGPTQMQSEAPVTVFLYTPGGTEQPINWKAS